jgi:hypothetical protein
VLIMAHPSHRPNPGERRQVEALTAYGVPEADIARVIGIDPKTLRKHYRDELDTGSIKATARVAEFLFRKATTEGHQCVSAAIFWMKTRGGWREAPQTHEIAVSKYDRMSEDELIARIRELDAQVRPLIELRPHEASRSERQP